MAMIEFEDHSEENQKALLAYLAGDETNGNTERSRGIERPRALVRLTRLLVRLRRSTEARNSAAGS